MVFLSIIGPILFILLYFMLRASLRKLSFEVSYLGNYQYDVYTRDPLMGGNINSLYPIFQHLNQPITLISIFSPDCGICAGEIKEYMSFTNKRPVHMVCFVQADNEVGYTEFHEKYKQYFPIYPIHRRNMDLHQIESTPKTLLVDQKGDIFLVLPPMKRILKQYVYLIDQFAEAKNAR